MWLKGWRSAECHWQYVICCMTYILLVLDLFLIWLLFSHNWEIVAHLCLKEHKLGEPISRAKDHACAVGGDKKE